MEAMDITQMTPEQRLEHIRRLARERAKRHYALHKAELAPKKSALAKGNREAINARRRARVAEQRAKEALANPPPPPNPNVVRIKIKGITFDKLDDLIGDKIENELTKTGHLVHIKSVMRLTVPELTHALKNADRLIRAIDNGKMINEEDYSLSSKVKMYQAVLKLSEILEIPIDKEKIADAYQITKMKLDDELEEKPQAEYPSFKTYLAQCAEKFNTDSREYLIAMMYSEFTCRDDLGLVITDKPLKTVNYLLINEKSMTIVLNQYKQREKYGVIKHNCSAKLRALIDAYMTKKGLKVGDLLFGVTHLTDIVSLTNKRLGYTTGINLYRHMKVTDTLKSMKGATPEERLALSKQMGHSPSMQKKYLR